MADTHHPAPHNHDGHAADSHAEPASIVIVSVFIGVVGLIIFVWIWLG